MKLRVTDDNGTTNVIENDLSAADALPEDVRRVIDRAKRSREGPVTLEALEPEFLIELYVETSLRRVESVTPGEKPTGIPWDRVRTRYVPPTATGGPGGAGGESPPDGGVSRGETPGPTVSGARGADE